MNHDEERKEMRAAETEERRRMGWDSSSCPHEAGEGWTVAKALVFECENEAAV